MSFTFYRQLDAMDCGPTCLRMVAKHYGRTLNIIRLRNLANISREGVSLLGISEAAEKVGFKTLAVKINFAQLSQQVPLPCILHWQQKHFVVLPPQKLGINRNTKIFVADPAVGIVKLDKQQFLEAWIGTSSEGVALLLQPTSAFTDEKDDVSASLSWRSIGQYLRPHKKYFTQIFLGLLAGSLLQLVFPFLTQSIVDTGINSRNLSFIYVILAAQLMLFFARTGIEFIRSRLLLFISTHINISLLTGFWFKLMKLPLSYFDTKLTGDLQQRLQDQKKIETFLTSSSLNILFSVFSLFIFSIVLLLYDIGVFGLFAIGSILYFLWVRIFLKYRRDLNYGRFTAASKENTATLQLIQGMQEIRLHHAERYFRWNWEHIQASLFKLNFKSLSLNQLQQAGALFINEAKNIFITFFVAKLVIEGKLTLGAMLAVQYIIGQMNAPVEQLTGFAQSLQDARIALERLNEIEATADEEPVDTIFEREIPDDKTITFKNVSFTYAGAGNTAVLENINLTIPHQKTTAVVGMSGSGKTTLLKLLLRFYENYSGIISIGENIISTPKLSFEQHKSIALKNLSPSFWRSVCGAVMQDGYIFNDTILGNIAIGQTEPDHQRVTYACNIANLNDFISSLPLGLQTKIGLEGNGISQGQRQRILIARAIYKNPDYLFFDEATNALDSNNEKDIMEHLGIFFKNRTVVVVAHRLSTVKNADKIVVIHKGKIAEEGTHEDLTQKRGRYYELVKNQLELG